MKYIVFLLLFFLIAVSCQQSQDMVTADAIVDKAITVSGGGLYEASKVSFKFRDILYESETRNGQKVLARSFLANGLQINDVRKQNSLERFVNGSLVALTDSIANLYANSVNSVHYFSRLPYGLNDKAVQKELLGKEKIKDIRYYKVKVTFSEVSGGEDFDDVYLYWFDMESFKPKYLAYTFQVDGGGMRFREAFNERYINGIRFVDYNNYKPKNKLENFRSIGQKFEADSLTLLSKIELKNIQVVPNN